MMLNILHSALSNLTTLGGLLSVFLVRYATLENGVVVSVQVND